MAAERKQRPPAVTEPLGEPEAPAAQPDAPSTQPEAPQSQPEASVAPRDQPETPGQLESEDLREPHEHEVKLERDLNELTAKAEKADEYLELAQRTKADFENYRKRAAREAANAKDRGVAKLALELLPAVDNLDRAVAAAQGAKDENEVAAGIKLVHADVVAALARMGIEPFSPEGEKFDPELHEAVAQQPIDGAEPGTIVEVYQRGYRHRDAVLRPARVVVAG